ncbi:beta/gamma crystallin family protein [Streptomyces sp. RS10V-4]|uniref:beta/gamma crystallin family protein n=1 Tax=Streptomyces rhizoryzae TaxID=2932493 RepID=UPI002004957B|nr:beta/gamma crystallin family protein [Streptomyces rhizoryzae]MCK7624378.1 beta/gamma crystallin family protein [Streptomyces rhizoryzae]
MAVRVIDGSGTAVCGASCYALYEGVQFNEHRDPARRVLVADEGVPDLAAHGFDGGVASLVNLTGLSLVLYTEPGYRGESLMFGPLLAPGELAGYRTASGAGWDRCVRSVDLVPARRTGPRPGLVDDARG